MTKLDILIGSKIYLTVVATKKTTTYRHRFMPQERLILINLKQNMTRSEYRSATSGRAQLNGRLGVARPGTPSSICGREASPGIKLSSFFFFLDE